MKIRVMIVSIIGLFFLGACSILDEVTNTVTYVDEATDYVNDVSNFVNEVPTLAQQAVSDEQARVELENKLEEMKDAIETFNSLQAPDVAADLHQQIVEHNQTALDGITKYLTNIENGKFDISVLENTEAIQSLKEIADTIDQIKQLGQ